VAQSCTLPYRRFAICGPRKPQAEFTSLRLPVENLRYDFARSLRAKNTKNPARRERKLSSAGIPACCIADIPVGKRCGRSPLFCCQTSSTMEQLRPYVLTQKDSRKGRQVFHATGSQRGRSATQRASARQTEQGSGRAGAQGRDVLFEAK